MTIDDTLDEEHDVAVIGAGNAALTAAIAAHDHGARVVVLEKAPYDQRGGNTRFSGSGFRFVYSSAAELAEICGAPLAEEVVVEPYPATAFADDLDRTTGGRIRPDLRDVLIAESQAVMRWMRTLGVEWELHAKNRAFSLAPDGRWHLAPGYAIRSRDEGRGLSRALFAAAERREIPIVYEASARDIAPRDGSSFAVAVDRQGVEHTLTARTVIVGSGGFEARAESRAEHLGPEWAQVKVRGSWCNTGDLLSPLRALGARSDGQWDGCHATPIDLDAPAYGDLELTDKTNRLSYPYGITVNLDGQRFFDEGADKATHTYARVGREVLRQRGGVALQIFDSKALNLLEARYATAQPVIADSIERVLEAAADRIAQSGRGELDVARALETVRAFNAAAGDGRGFDASRRDGCATTGVTPAKSNWAVPLDSAPYHAYLVTTGITFTFGGVAVDVNSAVVADDGTPIEGLYAVGEITGGFFYGNYPAGSGLMRGAVFGRRAGVNAAREALEAPAALASVGGARQRETG